jgi:integration host factor subunit beta
MIDAMISAMTQEERIEIRGFGSFVIRHYGSYEGRNPKTGQTIKITNKRLPFFKAGKDLLSRIN